MFSLIPRIRIHEFSSQNFSCFLLKQGRILLLRSKLFHTKRHFAAPLKENKTFFVKKIVDSEFVKICHEQVIWFYLNFWSCIKNIWDMVLRIPNFKFRTFRLLWRKNKQNFFWLVKKVSKNWEFMTLCDEPLNCLDFSWIDFFFSP